MYFQDEDDQNDQQDGRHQQRVGKMQLLFATTFDEQLSLEANHAWPELDEEWLKAINLALPELDALIAAHAPERPLSEINRIDLSIMRLIIHEHRTQQTPAKVLVDEAVELAKEFGSENSAKFVNGVLGKILFQESDNS
jgi:N utilization substance protein B